MTDFLDTIDASLEEVEEQLLDDFHRALDEGSSDGSIKLDPGIRTALAEVTEHLHQELEDSGRRELSLITERHEVLYSRIEIARFLFDAEMTVRLLVAARDGIETRRDDLLAKVRQQRRRDGLSPAELPKGGRTSRFDHDPTPQEKKRNSLGVTAGEEARFGQAELYLDNGIFSASRELSMLVSLFAGGTLDQPPEDAAATDRGKAVFNSKDLKYHAPPPEYIGSDSGKRDIAQSPEEIRRKLQGRSGSGGAASFTAKDLPTQSEPPRPRRPEPEPPKPAPTGRASFESRDLSSATFNEPPRPRRPEPKPEPEPPKPATGRASFAARDLSNAPSFSEPPRPRNKEPEKPAPAPTGKAVFASKDIAPVAPSDPPRRRDKKPEEKPAPEKRSGPAVFESRDLSNDPFKK